MFFSSDYCFFIFSFEKVTKNRQFSTIYESERLLLVKCDRMDCVVGCFMINVIIYEDNKEMQILYQEVVRNFFHSQKIKIKFHIFSSYVRNLERKLASLPGKKLFILDIEVPGKSRLDLARTIRHEGDWMSPLMVITSYENLKNTGFTSKVLMLDFISKRENVRKRLKESLETVYDIFHMKDAYTFQYNGKLFHIPFDDILYFEKDLNDNYTFLYTEDFAYKIKESITQIGKKLEQHLMFLKVHRSCIVNINRISMFNVKEKRIYLGKYSTNLITREGRDFLKKKLRPMHIVK